MRARTIDGVEIHYEVAGDGPAILLVHGIADSSADWDGIPDRLAEDHTVVTLDLRGHGQSSLAEDYSSLVMVQDVLTVLEATGAEAPLLVGHALGAVVVSLAAIQIPCRGVVNVDQALKFDFFLATIQALEDELRTGDFAGAMREIFDAVGGDLTPEPLRSRLHENRVTIDPEVVLGVWALTLRSTADEVNAMTGVVGNQITVPYLAIYGTDLGPEYPAWLAERIHTTVYEHWEGAGHYPHLVDPDRFVDRIRAFERTLGPAPSS